MSRQTSLQWTDQKSPECHHLFPAVKIQPKPEAGVPQPATLKTTLQRNPSLHAKNKSQKSGLTKAGTLTLFHASWERGSNENANRMIRRFIPKGADMADFSAAVIREIEGWINHYPRKILQFKTVQEMFNLELVA